MKKRGLSILLAFCMVLALLPVFATQASAVNVLWPVPGHTEWNRETGLHGAYYNGVQYRNAIDISDGSINGATVVAAMGGTVIRKYICAEQHYGSEGDCLGFGTGLVISGDDGKTYQYAHMQGGSIPADVYNGAYVSRGQMIGRVGTTGNSSGPHLHFGISNTSKFWENGDPTPGVTIYDYDVFKKDNNTLSQDYGNVFYAWIALCSPWKDLEAAGGENGANVQIAASNAMVPKQIWRFERTSDGSYIITNEYSGKALEVVGSGDWNTANVSLWEYGGAPGQRWFLSLNTSTNPHSYIFTPGHCDLVMDVLDGSSAPGANVQIYTRNGTSAQNFGVYPITSGEYEKPGKPTASSVTTTEAVVGTEVSIQWTESPLVNAWDRRTYTLTVKDSLGNTVLNKADLTDTSYSFTFPEAGTYTAQVTAVDTSFYDYKTVGTESTITVKTPVQTNPFTDVAEGKFYYDPILWAISQDPQITTGVTPTTFVPDRICTRAHVVTFLWRANGCPEPTNLNSNFKDVKDTSKYYYKAVLWAAEKGITTGYSDGTFRPDDECTRGQVVTFLWRAKGQPTASGSIPFTDVPAGKYYTTAVLWALKNNITKGRTATTFGPDDACTRGHVVTFLYRAYA